MNKSLFKMFSVITILALMLMTLPMQSAGAVSPDIVISQVYGGGGNTGATLKNDFIELFNLGTASISVSGWSVQYASTAGSTWQKTDLPNVTLAPGQYLLVQEAQGAGGTTNLPTPDATGSIAMSATAGKVALVNNNTLITSGTVCPSGATIVDFIGYGPATNCSETSSTTSNLSNTTAALRGADGCTDTDNNAADFTVGAPTPRNTASPLNPCEAPRVSNTTPNNGAVNVARNANITTNFNESVNVIDPWFTISCANSGIHTAAVSGGPTSFTLDPDTNFAGNELCTVTVLASQVTDQDSNDPPDNMSANYVFSFTSEDVQLCGDPATFIHDVQGNGTTSPITGSIVSIEGVVVGDYQAAGQFSGYHVQEEDADVDADPATSEGIFIFNTAFPVSAGDKVRVRGTVTEFVSSGQPLTELASVSNVLVCNSNNSVTASSVTLPVSNLSDWERYEGMLIDIAQDLTATENFTLGRFGEVALSVGGRLLNPTMVTTPGAAAIALQNLNDRSRILLDDGNNQQNIDPTIYPTGGLSASNTLRSGYTVNGLTGVLEQRFGVYRMQPVGAVTFSATNPRPSSPDPVGGTLRVAAMNVLNYFTTLDTGSAICGPSGTLGCRGANTAIEFTRQRDKIISAIVGLDADVIGLMEIENNATTAIQDLVDGLNAATAPGTYAFINTGTIGTDAIKVGLLYKPAKVAPVSAYAILDSTVDPTFIDTLNRPVLAQTFEELDTGARFTVAVNHLKSKGSNCNVVGDPDTGDGQGNCNLTRLAAAIAEANWLATDPTDSGDPDFLLIGDFNAYLKENPITALQSAGYTDLIDTFVGADAYSFVFQGQSGYLDHALSSSSLTSQVTGTTEWHANADEPIVLDYNTEFKSPNHVNTLYAPNAYRSSDHDPLIVGLGLDLNATCNGLPATIVGTTGNDVINGTNGPDVIAGLGGNDVINGGNGDDIICGYAGNDTLNGGSGNDTLLGSYGLDTLNGQNGIDTLDGGDDNDTLDGGNEPDTLYGGNGNDGLIGGTGNDVLDGGADNDALAGNKGDDSLTGGTGSDSFSGGAGIDTNVDFNAGQGDTTDGT